MRAKFLSILLLGVVLVTGCGHTEKKMVVKSPKEYSNYAEVNKLESSNVKQCNHIKFDFTSAVFKSSEKLSCDSSDIKEYKELVNKAEGVIGLTKRRIELTEDGEYLEQINPVKPLKDIFMDDAAYAFFRAGDGNCYGADLDGKYERVDMNHASAKQLEEDHQRVWKSIFNRKIDDKVTADDIKEDDKYCTYTLNNVPKEESIEIFEKGLNAKYQTGVSIARFNKKLGYRDLIYSLSLLKGDDGYFLVYNSNTMLYDAAEHIKIGERFVWK